MRYHESPTVAKWHNKSFDMTKYCKVSVIYRIALKYSYVSCLMCFILVAITRKCVLRYAAVVWWHIAYFQALSTTLEHLKLIARGYCIGGETFLAFNQEAFTQQTSLSYYKQKCKKYGGTIFSTNRSSCLHLIL